MAFEHALYSVLGNADCQPACDICAVTLSEFPGEKGADILSQNNFFGGLTNTAFDDFGCWISKKTIGACFRQ